MYKEDKICLSDKALKIIVFCLIAISGFIAGILSKTVVVNAEELVTVSNNGGTYRLWFTQHCEGYMGKPNHDSYGDGVCNVNTEYETTFTVPIDSYFYAIVAIPVYSNKYDCGSEGHYFVAARFNLIDKTVDYYKTGGWGESLGWSANNTAHALVEDSYGSDLMIFDTLESMKNYCLTGDDSGQLNKPEIEDALGNFSLLNFSIDETITAEWNGINCPPDYVLDDVYVQVRPLYFVILEKDEDYQAFNGVKMFEVPYSDYGFTYLYDDFFIDNPYKGRCQLYLEITPIYKPTDCLKWQRGQTISVMYDENGKLESCSLPESSLSPQYDSACKFVYPYGSYSKYNNSFYIGWDDVSYNSSNKIVSNWIKVDFVNSIWQSVGFSTDFYWSDKFMIIDYEAIEHSLRRTDDTTPLYIKLTPYYKTENGLFYGHSFSLELDGKKVVGEYESTGDPFFGDVSAGDSLLKPVEKEDPIFVGGVTDDESSDNQTFDFENIFSNFIALIKSFLNSAGQVPALVNRVFSFLPSSFSSMITVALSIVVILRIIGR